MPGSNSGASEQEAVERRALARLLATPPQHKEPTKSGTKNRGRPPKAQVSPEPSGDGASKDRGK